MTIVTNKPRTREGDVTAITICLNWMAIVIAFTVSSSADEQVWPRLRLDRSARREEDET
jgi:hypothetical protein